MSKDENVVAVIGEEVQTENELELSNENQTISTKAQSIVVKTSEDYEVAAEFAKELKKQANKVVAFFKPMKEAANRAHQQVCDREKQMLKPLTAAQSEVKTAMGAYLQEQERIRREQEEAARKLAEEEAQKKLEEAAKAESAGDTEAAKAAFMDAEIIDTAGASMVVQSAAPKVKGISTSKDWEITGIDTVRVPAVVAGMEIRPVDKAAVMRLIRATKGQITIPGIQYKEITKLSVSGR